MTPHKIRCVAQEVRTDSKICPGLAKTEQGETYLFDARTPGSRGICGQAFTAMNSLRMALAVTDKEGLNGLEFFDVTCPHGAVTFRISRES